MKRLLKRIYLFFYATFLYSASFLVIALLVGAMLYATCQPNGEQYLFDFCAPLWDRVEPLKQKGIM